MRLSNHDRIVLKVARNLLRKGEKEITINNKIKGKNKILKILREEFPDRKIL